MSLQRVIPLAQIVREHGVPKQGRHAFKAELFHVGSQLFSHHRRIALQESPASPWRELELIEAASPQGGKWGISHSVLLTFDQPVPRGSLVGLSRDFFPELPSGEVYLCDLMGLPVEDEQGMVGHVEAFLDPGRGAPINLLVKALEGASFAFPLKWVDWTLSGVEQGRLKAPGVRAWQNL